MNIKKILIVSSPAFIVVTTLLISINVVHGTGRDTGPKSGPQPTQSSCDGKGGAGCGRTNNTPASSCDGKGGLGCFVPDTATGARSQGDIGLDQNKYIGDIIDNVFGREAVNTYVQPHTLTPLNNQNIPLPTQTLNKSSNADLISSSPFGLESNQQKSLPQSNFIPNTDTQRQASPQNNNAPVTSEVLLERNDTTIRPTTAPSLDTNGKNFNTPVATNDTTPQLNTNTEVATPVKPYRESVKSIPTPGFSEPASAPRFTEELENKVPITKLFSYNSTWKAVTDFIDWLVK